MLAQDFGIAKQFRDAFHHGQNLIPAHERIQPCSEIRFSRKTAGDTQREADLRPSANRALNRSQTDVVNLRIRAPYAATGDGNFELAGQVVEVGIARQ